MPGRAKPDEEKRHIFNKTQDKWMDKAVEMYKMKQKNTSGEKKLGLRGVCRLMKEACWKEDKAKISLDKSSLTRRLNGVPSQAQSKASKGWQEERQTAREAHAETLAVWKKLEEGRKERNAEIRKAYLDAVKEWEVERDTAKLEKRRARWPKPKQGKLEKGIPRPKKPEMGGSDGEDELDADQETEHDDDD